MAAGPAKDLLIVNAIVDRRRGSRLARRGEESRGAKRKMENAKSVCDRALNLVSERDHAYTSRATCTNKQDRGLEFRICPINHLSYFRRLLSMLPTKRVECLKWKCQSCDRECIPIRSESRCLCGHRLKEHTEENYGSSALIETGMLVRAGV